MSATPTLPAYPGLDCDLALAQMGGDTGLFMQLVRLFLEQHAADVPLIDAALAERDFDLALHLLHALRGTAGNLGAIRVQAAALADETVLRDRISEPAAASAELRAAMAELTPALRRLLVAGVPV